jgi:hypothetical protein
LLQGSNSRGSRSSGSSGSFQSSGSNSFQAPGSGAVNNTIQGNGWNSGAKFNVSKPRSGSYQRPAFFGPRFGR